MKHALQVFVAMNFLLLSACTASNTPESARVTALPAGSQEPAATRIIPTPSDNKGVITGVLLEGTEEFEPASNAVLYLADIVASTDGRKAAASFDRATSPNTQTDAHGRFVFSDVEPGEYALVLDRIYNSFLLHDPDGEGDLLFTAEAGETVDLGRLEYLSLPESTLQ
jgi:hypothetical protein